MRTIQIRKRDARNFNDYIITVSSTAFAAAEAFSPRKFYYASSYGWRADVMDTLTWGVSIACGYEHVGNLKADEILDQALVALTDIGDYDTRGPVSRAAYETAINEFIKRIKGN